MATLSIPATTGDVKASALTRLTEQLVELQAIHAEWRLLGKAAALYCQYLESDGDLAISTKVAYRGDVLAFVDAMDDLSVRLIGEVEASHVDVWRHALCDLAPSSVSRKLVALSGFFKWAVMWQITARNPVDPVKRPRKRRKDAVYVTADHFDRLLAACRSAKERAVLGSMYWAGLRRQEVTALEMGSVNLEERSLRVTGKGGHVREVPICWKLAALVRDHLKGVDARDPAAPLFADRLRRRLSPKTVNRWFSKWSREAGLEGLGYSPHSCRHGAGYLYGAEGFSSFELSKFLGHSDPRTTMGYVHVTAQSIREKMDQSEVFGRPDAPAGEDPSTEDLRAEVKELTSVVKDLLGVLAVSGQDVPQLSAEAC